MTPSQRAAEDILWMLYGNRTIVEANKAAVVRIIESECGRWHPCPEEKPEKTGRYPVTLDIDNHAPIVEEAIYNAATEHWFTSFPVLAFRPLPEPYQKGG